MQIAPAGSVPPTWPIITEEITSPTSVFFVAIVPANGARTTMSCMLMRICSTRARAALSCASALSSWARVVTPSFQSAACRFHSRSACSSAALRLVELRLHVRALQHGQHLAGGDFVADGRS